MFLSGLGASAAAPQIVLFLVKELGTPLPIAGLYYLTNLTAPIAGYLVGNHSDRTGERLTLFRLYALAGFAGWAAIALSTKVWMPFLISSLILAFSVVELAILPFCVTLGRRVGFLWLMCIGAAFGVAANICFATTANALGMFAG